MYENGIDRRYFILTIAFTILLLIGGSAIANIPLGIGSAQNVTSGNTTNNNGNTNNTDILSGENMALQSGDIIPNEWIVTLKENATIDVQTANSSIAALSDEAENSGVQILQTLPELGVLVIKTPPTEENGVFALADVEDNSNVLSVEPNRVVTKSEQDIPTGIDRIDAEPGIESGSLGENTTAANSMSANVSQSVNSSAMDTTTPVVDAVIGIIDSGIDLTHPDLNVVNDVTFVPGTTNGNDDDGHGTHVAGIAAAKDDGEGVVGVAPGAELWAIKVLDASGSGSTATVLSGINYAIQNANALDVINLSLGGAASVAENTAIKRAVDSGITVVVAAGNDHDDAINHSPASAPEAITVSGLADSDGKCGGEGPITSRGIDDSVYIRSNYGEVVDMMAPGVEILSTWKDGGYNTISGTSMASPYVAGAAALYKSANPSATPEQILDALNSIASTITTTCNPESGHGYLVDRSFDLDEEAEPLLYTKNLVGMAK